MEPEKRRFLRPFGRSERGLHHPGDSFFLCACCAPSPLVSLLCTPMGVSSAWMYPPSSKSRFMTETTGSKSSPAAITAALRLDEKAEAARAIERVGKLESL
jgi:hypothetical protein